MRVLRGWETVIFGVGRSWDNDSSSLVWDGMGLLSEGKVRNFRMDRVGNDFSSGGWIH